MEGVATSTSGMGTAVGDAVLAAIAFAMDETGASDFAAGGAGEPAGAAGEAGRLAAGNDGFLSDSDDLPLTSFVNPSAGSIF